MKSRVRTHTPGVVRYFTYWIRFPDGEEWVDQTPVVHSLDFALQNSQFRKSPQIMNDLLTKGETHWKDHNGVEHVIKVENSTRDRVWGTKRGKPLIKLAHG